MNGLDRATELRLARELTIELSGGSLSVRRGSEGAHRLSPSLLPLLAAFHRPQRLEAVVTRFAGEAPFDWMEVTAGVVRLVRAGILVPSGGQNRPVPIGSPGFGSAPAHISMLNDDVRTGAFIEAVRRFVRPDDVVLDIGSGTGILAIAAAEAGARRVYAVERTEIADAAAAMISRSQAADRITLVRASSGDVELPERATALVSEILGNDPFEEQILAVTRDARKRHLEPEGRLMPQSVRLSAVPVSLSPALREAYLFTPEMVERWTRSYGLDFSALPTATRAQPEVIHVSSERAAACQRRGPDTVMGEVDLKQPSPRVVFEGRLEPHPPEAVDAIVLHWEATLVPGVQVTTDPWRAAPKPTSWRLPVWLLPPPPPGRKRRRMAVRYAFSGVRSKLEVADEA
ncbi:MAG: 50S ribosomal protein L11 methyltransferase [Myxococcota bacterium]